jgi:hypothetical protein
MRTDKDINKTLTQEPLFTQVTVVEELQFGVGFETLPEDLYSLGYTCLLTPASTEHQLIGPLKDSVLASFHGMCALNHWQLEFIAVEPTYVQWAVYVQSAIPMERIMQIARKETSRALFSELTNDAELGRDFWAFGHLVVVGIHPHLPKTIEHFLKLIRRQVV